VQNGSKTEFSHQVEKLPEILGTNNRDVALESTRASSILDPTTGIPTIENKLTVVNRGEILQNDTSGIVLPLKNGDFYDLSKIQVSEWKQVFDKIDVEKEIKLAVAWCNANPDRMKTRRGAARFLYSWLSRAKPSSQRTLAKSFQDQSLERALELTRKYNECIREVKK
jgi:hypothetical protein